MIKKLCKNGGFTIIELIVVIAVIGVLVGIIVPVMIGFMGSARKNAARADAKIIYTTAQAYINKQMAIDCVERSAIQLPTKEKLVQAGFIEKEPDGTLTLADADVNDAGMIVKLTYVIGKYTVTMPDGEVTE